MQFTPQQLVGAGRYAPCTRIGNWNEDLMLEEARLREFQLRKKQGSLLATHKLKQDFLHQRAPRSFDSQQRIRFHQAVGVRHLASGAALACNVFEETPSIGSGEFLVTALPVDKGAMARTTFRIINPADYKASLQQSSGMELQCTDTSTAKPLVYGEPFFLVCNEALLVDSGSVLLRPPLFLKSGLKSDRSMSPITYNQRVWIGPEPDSGALWVCARADLTGAEKTLAEGSPVLAGDTFTVLHKMTGQPLRVDTGSKLPTDFGAELEVCALAARNAGKLHHLAAEAEGIRTADTEGRPALPENAWTFELAARAEDARDDRALPEMPSAATVMGVVQQCLATESLYAFRRFVATLLRMDGQNGSGHLDRERVKMLLTKEYKLPLREEQLDLMFDAFDKRNAGFFSTGDFLKKLRLPLSGERAEWATKTFDRLLGIAGGSVAGSLSLSALTGHYDVNIDSRVRSNQLTPAAATAEYRELWALLTPDVITRREFLDAYADVSAIVAHDEHFAQLLEESWT